MSGQPSVSLHVSNLNHGVSKTEIRRSLYSLFSLYGKVIDVVHTRNGKVRGTAFLVFRDLASSTQALRSLDGEIFYGRQLRVAYAQSTSHATIAEAEGPEAVYQIKIGLRSAEGNAKPSKLTVSGAGNKLAIDQKKRQREEAEEEEESSEEEGEPAPKKGKPEEEDEDDDAMDEESSDDEAPQTKQLGPPQPAAGTVANAVLFAQGLPAEVTNDMLSALFGQYAGLASVKLLPTPAGSGANRGIAFINYENAGQAEVAREALDGFLLAKGAPLGVAYAQRG